MTMNTMTECVPANSMAVGWVLQIDLERDG